MLCPHVGPKAARVIVDERSAKPDIGACAGHPDIPLKGECPECPASRTCEKTKMSGLSGKMSGKMSGWVLGWFMR
jgi:hypothetical protein